MRKKSVLIFVDDIFWLDVVEEFVLDLINNDPKPKHLRRRDARIVETELLVVEIIVATGYSMRGKRANIVLNLCHKLNKSMTPQEFHEQVAMTIMRYERPRYDGE